MSDPQENVKDAPEDGTNKAADANETNPAGTDTERRVGNPLTMIGIFASIAEGAGAAVLPLIDQSLHATFIWFLIGFPTLLVILFFITLNINHLSLYAPGDYRNDMAFIASTLITQKYANDIAKNIDDIEDFIKNVGETINDTDSGGARELGVLGTSDTQELVNAKISDIKMKLEETKTTAYQSTQITKDIQKLSRNPKKLMQYLVDTR